jgi:hypothetical protein
MARQVLLDQVVHQALPDYQEEMESLVEMAHQVLQVHQVEVVHQDQQVQLVLRQAAAAELSQ